MLRGWFIGPERRSIYFSLALSIGVERRTAGYDVIPLYAATARCTVAYKNCLNTLLRAALVSQQFNIDGC